MHKYFTMQCMRFCHYSVQCLQSVNLSDCAALTHFSTGLLVAFTEPLHATNCFPATVGNMGLKFAEVRFPCITRVCKM